MSFISAFSACVAIYALTKSQSELDRINRQFLVMYSLADVPMKEYYSIALDEELNLKNQLIH